MARMFNGLANLFGNASSQTTSSPQPMRGGYNDHEGTPASYGGTPNHMASINAPVGSPEVDSRSQSIDQLDNEASEREDLLDQHVAYYLKHNPEVHTKHRVSRVRPGVYNYDGREISVEWHYSEDPDQPGFLIAVDGPLRQPFAEYMQDNEVGIQYDDKRLGRSALSQIPKGKRLSFGDGNKVYSRLEAMKVAKEQALVREQAAGYAKDGMMVPQQDLMNKYKKTISQKLGERRQRRPDPEVQAQPPAEAPIASPAPAAPPAAVEASPPPPASQGKGKQTHGAPKYCSKHDKTEKRKKVKPQNLPCSSCQQVIQTNYSEFTLCPTCSEKDHRCMCCGAAAVGVASSPQAQQQAPSSPMNARSSPNHSSKSPAGGAQEPSSVSPMNLFGMPDLFGAKANGPSQPQSNAGGFMQGFAGFQQPASTKMPAQNNAFASARAPANPYASQNAFASYNPMASQNMIVRPR